MHYVSTRGGSAPVDFLTACLSGLAPDGGLFVPEAWPELAPAIPGEAYPELAARILSGFAGEALEHATLEALCQRAYASFAHMSVAPLVQAGPDLWLMELHNGPTLAFKDVAMQLLAQLYDHALTQRGERMTIVCATSGDTGGAAAHAFAGAAAVDLVILHPDERVSPVQRRFMTTTGAKNVLNLAVEGDFDDCQALVKALFADKAYAGRIGLSGVNSINWVRIAAQSVYYAAAQAALGRARDLRFIVPTGNMGDALAGYVASQCGLLAGFEAVGAINDNRALSEILETGTMRRVPARATPSPAMDISVPSNFERLVYEASGRDGAQIRRLYEQFAQAGVVSLGPALHTALGQMGLSALGVSAQETAAEIARTHGETGWLVCPHTAVGLAAARRCAPDKTQVVLATAHAAKFPDTVAAASGCHPAVPGRCANMLEREEVYEAVPTELDGVKARIDRFRAMR